MRGGRESGSQLVAPSGMFVYLSIGTFHHSVIAHRLPPSGHLFFCGFRPKWQFNTLSDLAAGCPTRSIDLSPNPKPLIAMNKKSLWVIEFLHNWWRENKINISFVFIFFPLKDLELDSFRKQTQHLPFPVNVWLLLRQLIAHSPSRVSVKSPPPWRPQMETSTNIRRPSVRAKLFQRLLLFICCDIENWK